MTQSFTDKLFIISTLVPVVFHPTVSNQKLITPQARSQLFIQVVKEIIFADIKRRSKQPV